MDNRRPATHAQMLDELRPQTLAASVKAQGVIEPLSPIIPKPLDAAW